MGLFSSGGAPAGPNPIQLINAQANANRVNQITPQGNLVYGTMQNGQFTANPKPQAASMIQQTPYQAQMQGITEGTATNLANSLSGQASNLQGMSLEGLPQLTSGLDMSKIRALPGQDDFSADAGRVEQATFDRIANLLNPQFDLQQRRLETSMADRGLPFSGEAQNAGIGRFYDAKNRAFTDAALQAVGAGRAEQQRLFGNTMTARGAETQDQLTNAGLAASARSTGLGEQKTIRDQQLSELASLLGGSYQPTPQASFAGPGQVDVTGPYQLAQNAQLAGYNANQGMQQALLGGLFGLGSAGIGLL